MDTNPKVYPFHLRGDDSVRMRVVVLDDDVIVERHDGNDALGVDRWQAANMEEEDDYEDPIVSAHDWVAMAVLAVVKGSQP